MRNREYLMIYRGPGFLAVVLFGSSPCTPFVVSLSQSSCVSPVELTNGRGGRGAKTYDDEKAWPSINHSILSAED
jgi:hypothetical protein